MNLPRPALATRTLQLGDASVAVEIRSLTASQALHVNAMTDESGRAAWMLACGFGVTQEEAAEWLDAVSFELATTALLAIVELSGLEGQVEVSTDAGPKGSRGRKLTSVS